MHARRRQADRKKNNHHTYIHNTIRALHMDTCHVYVPCERNDNRQNKNMGSRKTATPATTKQTKQSKAKQNKNKQKQNKTGKIKLHTIRAIPCSLSRYHFRSIRHSSNFQLPFARNPRSLNPNKQRTKPPQN